MHQNFESAISAYMMETKTMARQKPVVIKTLYPALEETRKKFGISKKRAKELVKMMDEILKNKKAGKKQ